MRQNGTINMLQITKQLVTQNIKFVTLHEPYGSVAEKRDLRTYANSEDPDQTVHLRSLVRIFTVCLHNIGTLLKI